MNYKKGGNIVLHVDTSRVLVKNTTREQRIKIIKSNIGLVFGNGNIDESFNKLLNDYIEGKIELSQIRANLIKFYRREN